MHRHALSKGIVLVLALGPHLRRPCARGQICKMHSHEKKLQDVPSFRPCACPWSALERTLRARPLHIIFHNFKIWCLTKNKARVFGRSSYRGCWDWGVIRGFASRYASGDDVSQPCLGGIQLHRKPCHLELISQVRNTQIVGDFDGLWG